MNAVPKPGKRKKKKKSIQKLEKERLVGRLDEMWSYLIKYRDGFKSVLSSSDKDLCSHHIFGRRGCYHWWDFSGGITITRGEYVMTHGQLNWSHMEPMRIKIVEYLGG